MTRSSALIAGGLAMALLAAGCGSSDDTTEGPTGDSGEQITLTLAIWDDFGYDEMLQEYMDEHPNIRIEVKEAVGSGESRENLFTKLAAGSGLSDVEAIEGDWLAEVMQYADEFVDLSDPALEDRWLPWKVDLATTPDGRLIGYGTDIGPEAVCYRADMFEAAGLPTDREEVAELLGGDDPTWDDYFAVGRQFVANSDAGWFDSAGGVFNVMVNQMAYPYEDADNNVIAAQNPELKAAYDTVLTEAVENGLSAQIPQWSDDWFSGFQNEAFATVLCPAWMLGTIEGGSAGVEGWDVANTFPGGGGNMGGSFFAVPNQSAHPEEAKEFAAWLTAPEQQLKVFFSDGQFPSQIEAMNHPDLLSSVNSFFNDAPTGQILSDRAEAIEVVAHKGPNYFAVNEVIMAAVQRVDVDQVDDAESSWAKFLQDMALIG